VTHKLSEVKIRTARHHPRGSVRRASGFVLTGDSEVMALNDYSAVNRPNLGSQGEVSKLHRILHPDCLRVRRKRSNTMTLYV